MRLPSPKCPFCRPPDLFAFFDAPAKFVKESLTFLAPHRHVELLGGVWQRREVGQPRQLPVVIPLQGAKGEPLVNCFPPILLKCCKESQGSPPEKKTPLFIFNKFHKLGVGGLTCL